MTLSLATRPLTITVLLTDACMQNRDQQGSYNILVLLNRSVLEGVDVICKVTGHIAADHQLEKLSKLIF